MAGKSPVFDAGIANDVGIAPDVLEIWVPREVGLLVNSVRYVITPNNIAWPLDGVEKDAVDSGIDERARMSSNGNLISDDSRLNRVAAELVKKILQQTRFCLAWSYRFFIEICPMKRDRSLLLHRGVSQMLMV
jgi:hypothetical protein